MSNRRTDDIVTDWELLSAGFGLGKRAVFHHSAVAPLLSTDVVNFLEIRGDDRRAMQLSVTLSPPRFSKPADVAPYLASGRNLQDFPGPWCDNGEVELATGPTTPNLCAFVEWGIGGVSERAAVDMSNGLCINLQTSFLRIGGFIEQPFALTSQVFYELSAFVGPGTPKGNRNATKTVIAPILLAGIESAIMRVPRFAREVIIASVATPPSVALSPVTIVFYRGPVGGGVNPIARYTWSQALGAIDRVPVPNGSLFFTLQCAAEQLATPIFELAI